MSGEVLREAAALMRARVAGATPGPWLDDDSTPAHCVYSDAADMFVTCPTDWDVGGGDTRHIASWHPLVALAVADWLEVTERDTGTSSTAYHAALALARAYLGTTPTNPEHDPSERT